MRKFMAIMVIISAMMFASPAFAVADAFADVPEDHWAYDAVKHLRVKGIISGLPEDVYDGSRAISRYEMASIVARALTKIDIEKIDKGDLRLVQKLVVEFEDELDAIGVKLDNIDRRLTKLEEKLGGWRLFGRYMFCASFASGDQEESSYTEGPYDTSFEKQWIRMYLIKQIDKDTHFFAEIRGGSYGIPSDKRGAKGDVQFVVRMLEYVSYLPWDVRIRVGRFFIGPEDENHLYYDGDPMFRIRADAIELVKTAGDFEIWATIGRNSEYTVENYTYTNPLTLEEESAFGAFMSYTLKIYWQPKENFSAGVFAAWLDEDSNLDEMTDYIGTYSTKDLDLATYSAFFSYKIVPDLALEGIYYQQRLGDSFVEAKDGVQDPHAYKIMLTYKGRQDFQVCYGLHLEYVELDNAFVGQSVSYGLANFMAATPNLNYLLADPQGTSRMFFINYHHIFNEKWNAYVRYIYQDYDTEGLEAGQEYGVALFYQMTPNVGFKLAFDEVDYGDNPSPYYSGKDRVIQLRTQVTF